MPEEVRINLPLIDKLEELQNEYAARNKLLGNDGDDGDIYIKEKSGSEDLLDLIDCAFKDDCNAFKSNSGTRAY